MKEREECEICHKWGWLETHHIFYGTANRKISEKWGMVAILCPACHQYGKYAVHSCRASDLRLKEKYQKIFEETHTREEFVSIFGKNYL